MEQRKRVYLIRHGQVNGFENIPVYGHTDVRMTRIGFLQMKQISERLRLIEIDAVYSSDLTRCEVGADIIASFHNVPVTPLHELREMYFGDWEGLSLSEIINRFPEELSKRKADLIHYQIPGGGETVDDFSVRITRCFERILTEKKEKDVVIVAHGAVNRIIICNVLGLDFTAMLNLHQDYGCLNIIDFYSDSTLVRLING